VTRVGNSPTGRETPQLPSGYLLAAVALLLAAPASLLAWAAGAAALRAGARRPVLALAGLLPGCTALAVLGPSLARTVAGAVLGVAGGSGAVRPSLALLAAVAGSFARWAVVTAPVGIPAGLVAAAVPPREPAVPRPEWQAGEQRARQREELRARKRAARRADREGADPRSGALAISLGGSVDEWRIGDLVIPPPRQLGYAWLLLGAPGVGKSTASERLGYLCGQERRHLVVIDAKGGPDGLAEGMVAAYLAGWAAGPLDHLPTVRLFPQERLDIWRGDAQAVVNRLVEVWDWTAESSYWREVAMTALRLALGQPGPPCTSGAELVRRLDPGRLVRAWEHDPDTLGLVQKLAKGDDLPGVHIRVGNLVAALSGALDGHASWEDADCWVVTVPAMVASRDADSCLRVLLADYAHFTMARKQGRPSHLLVDEFAAIGGGRRSAIDLLERGRGARSGVTLSGQSAVALGPEEDRGRLLASASAVLLFRSPQPAEIAALAGSERVAEGAWQADGDDLTGRATITTRARARIDQDLARQLPTGEAELIVHGHRERLRIIRTAIPPSISEAARELVAGQDQLCAAAPADAVTTREIPAPPPPRQGQARSARGSASLDPPEAPRVRRHRPPPVVGGSPGSDRDNQEE
jgi:hypothetical protein